MATLLAGVASEPLEVVLHTARGPLEWLPVVAVTGALAVSALGLYLNYRSRLSAARDQLHQEQVRLLLEYSYSMFDSAILCSRVIEGSADPEDLEHLETRTEELQELVSKVHAVFPDDVCRVIWEYNNLVGRVFDHESSECPTWEQVGGAFTRVLRSVRSQLGIGALSRDAKSLFGA